MSISLQKAFEVVKDHFNGDVNECMKWFRSSLSEFRGVSPLQMIHDGQEKQVIQFVQKNFVRR